MNRKLHGKTEHAGVLNDSLTGIHTLHYTHAHTHTVLPHLGSESFKGLDLTEM